MQGSSMHLYSKLLLPLLHSARAQTLNSSKRHGPCDVFINHRGIDTKRTISGLLYDHLQQLGLNPFLDSKNMKPGDRLFDNIERAIGECKVGIAVFSPRYCESYFCLHELARIMESKKRVIPIFCNVKPSQLRVRDDGRCPKDELERFKRALEEAKYTVGLTFDTLRGDWSELMTSATDAVMRNLIEVDGEVLHDSRSEGIIEAFNGEPSRMQQMKIIND